jgi:Chaperone of endosialidase
VGLFGGNNVTTANNVICIGTVGVNASNSCFIGNIWNQPGGSQAVYVNSDGRLGAQVSSRRFKDDIKPINQASEAIHRLRPVSFRYKAEIEPTRPIGFGLIAEEVEKINPDLVSYDQDGKPFVVRYEAVNAMMLNEFLKEHHTVQEMKSTLAKQEAMMTDQRKDFDSKLAQQQKQIDALTAGLQKVSAQLEASKPAPQVANNP